MIPTADDKKRPNFRWALTLANLAKTIKEFHNSKSDIKYIPYEKAYSSGFEDMERRVPNIELIKSLVGWEPKRDLSSMISDIADSLETN